MIFKDMGLKYFKYNDSAQAKEKWNSVTWFRAVTKGWEMPYFRGSRQRAMYHLQHCQKALGVFCTVSKFKLPPVPRGAYELLDQDNDTLTFLDILCVIVINFKM